MFLILAIAINAQQQDDFIRVTGDTLIGLSINGESIREVHGNVVIIQGAVRITSNKAIHYLSRNSAELIGNVVVTQDSVTIKTKKGYYDGNKKTASSTSGIWLSDGHVELESVNGIYFFDDKRSNFFQNVILKDLQSTFSADSLNYFDDEDKAVAFGNVIVRDTVTELYADSLVHYRELKKTFAFKNVRLYDSKNKSALFGDYLEDRKLENYSKVLGNSFLFKIDSTSAEKYDTLMLSSKMMEIFNDSLRKLIATDSVTIIRGTFSSLNSKTIYYDGDGFLETNKQEGDLNPPILWNENTQLTGDSVKIFVEENKLNLINIRQNSSIISVSSDSLFRYDQISGKNVMMYFGDDGLERSDIRGNVLCIYYLYEDGEPNGLMKASSENAKMFFDDKKVSDVRFYIKAISEYHPENLIHGNEKSFTIPTFKIYTGKPDKEKMLSSHSKMIEFIIKDGQLNVRKNAAEQ